MIGYVFMAAVAPLSTASPHFAALCSGLSVAIGFISNGFLKLQYNLPNVFAAFH